MYLVNKIDLIPLVLHIDISSGLNFIDLYNNPL